MSEVPQGDSRIDSNNSSNEPLANGESFTGDWTNVSHVDSIVVAVTTDQDGIYSIQFSPDGVNVDSTLTRYYNTNQFNVPHRFTVARAYCRVVFTNDSGSDQTYFRLQSIVGTKAPLNVPTDSIVAQDYDATVVRPTNHQEEVNRGLRQGVTSWHKFAYREGLTAAAGEETLWADSSNFVVMTSANNFTINYNSGTDGLGTTGATALLIDYLDENFNLAQATHVLSNTGTDTTSFTGLGINRCVVVSSGSANVNNNDITITDGASPENTQAFLPAGQSVTQQLVFHFPIGHTAVAHWLFIGTNKLSGSTHKVTFKVYVYNRLVETQYEVFRHSIDTNNNSALELNDPNGFNFSGRDVMWMVADTNTNNAAAEARMSFNIYRNASG